jgi:NAD(P)-dependent dehydrogenase (short-subunit alcohol dehydrogenase family)
VIPRVRETKETAMEQELGTALVTGANRGLGRQFAAGLLARGATVYAAARRPDTVDNVLSVLSWVHLPASGAYSAAKAAAWALTDALRQELAARGVHLAGTHVGYMATEMVSYVPAEEKIDPAVLATVAFERLFAGEPEILADDVSRTVKAQLSDSHLER